MPTPSFSAIDPQLVRWFADPNIGAVAGNAKVGNRINLITRWQALEYITARTWSGARSPRWAASRWCRARSARGGARRW